MNLLQSFQQFIEQEHLFSPKDRLLLAVSGGIDSVVLCKLCHQAGYDFVIAHCNFQLRGAESDADEAFVKKIGELYNKPVLVKRFDTNAYAAQHKVSIQVAARELRYDWFDRETSNVNREGVDPHLTVPADASRLTPDASRLTAHASRLPSHVVTAHHLNDNIETMLMNFFKGTGIAGIRGILARYGKIVRPLLFAPKEALQQFAREHQLSWREDSSNQSDKYARNYFRNQVIPLVKNVYPEAENNLAQNLQRFKEIELLYHQSVNQHKKKLLEYKGSEVHIPVLKLKKTEPLKTIVYEIIKDYHFSAEQVAGVIALLHSETGKYVQSSTHRIIRNRNWLIISTNTPAETSHIVIDAPGRVAFGMGQLELVLRPYAELVMNSSTSTAFLDASKIKFPLLLRKWKTGDYFYPLGMEKKKKLGRFFIDLKLSKTAKEKIWVLEMDKKIIWVVGYRIDNRFRLTPSTQQVLQIQLEALDI